MSIVSPFFFLLVLLSVIVYYILPVNRRWILLLICSIGFFTSGDARALIYMAVTGISVYVCAVKSQGSEVPSVSKAWIGAGLFINIGLWLLTKFNILPAPMGISFYTFSAVGYLLDVYWKETEAQGSPGKMGLFIFYFPQLTSGPISSYKSIKEGMYTGDTFSGERIYRAVIRILWGLFKKLVISARASVIVNTIYGDPDKYSGLYLVLAAGLFMMELYTDFSGCMDIIMGVSELYGISLPENFRTPFFSRSVQEYWQRWHITLGGWMRDYLMYPLLRSEAFRNLNKALKDRIGKKAARKITSYLGMLAVWLVIGLWHGGEWKYIIGEGLFFWACIVAGELAEPYFKKLIALLSINTKAFSWHLFQSVRVYILVCTGNLFFRLGSMREVFYVLGRMADEWNPWIFADGSLYELGLDIHNLNLMIVSLVILLLVSSLQEKGSVRDMICRQNLLFKYFIAAGLLWMVAVFGMYGPGYDAASFIYGGF